MAVLDPVKLVITNYPEGNTEDLQVTRNPEKPEEGHRMVPFSKTLYIERNDFMEDPPKKFFRLAPGREVRLKYAYIIKCESVVKDASGQITEIHCTYDPDTKSGMGSTRKVKGTLHWVSAEHALEAEVRLYDRLFNAPNPDDVVEGGSFKDHLNPDSLKVIKGLLEPSVKDAGAMERFQFERTGYFCIDPDSKPNALIFNRTVSLRDSWAKMNK